MFGMFIAVCSSQGGDNMIRSFLAALAVTGLLFLAGAANAAKGSGKVTVNSGAPGLNARVLKHSPGTGTISFSGKQNGAMSATGGTTNIVAQGVQVNVPQLGRRRAHTVGATVN